MMKSKTVFVNRAFVISLLITFYAFAFIISPYWLAPASLIGKILMLALITGTGVAWSYLSGDSLQIRLTKHWFIFFVFLAGLALVNFKSLISGIPWRGDENFHIHKVLLLASNITPQWLSTKWIFLGIAMFVLFFFTAWKKSKWALFIGCLLLVSIAFIYLQKNPYSGLEETYFLRYPFISYWFFVFVPKLAMSITSPYQEYFYRIIPMLSSAGIVWVCMRRLESSHVIPNLIWAISIATIPLISYYSTILYLELPAVFLMTVVCFDIETLLKGKFSEIRHRPGWYALILIGFIKETTFVFILCYLACRMILMILQAIREYAQKQPLDFISTFRLFRPRIAENLAIVFCVSWPSLLYLVLRSNSSVARKFAPDISSLLNFSVYEAFGRSLFEQFGLFSIIFIGGCILLVSIGKYAKTTFIIMTFLAFPVLFALDTATYTGLGRFNLFILPAILTSSTFALNWLTKNKKTLGISIVSLAILTNIFLSPVNLDGTKKPFGPNYLTDIYEHYYPYPETIAWLKESHGNENILFTGLSYPYYVEFYFEKLDWHPQYELSYNTDNDELKPLSKTLTEAEEKGYSVVVYHLLGGQIPQADPTWHYQQEKIISNKAHSLIIYSKIR
jgi:hypothetical protein